MVQINSPIILQYLDTLLKHGNYTKAAKDLYVSQPYLTQTIKKIEKELGTEVINRQTSPLQLTEAGRIYYQYLNSLETEQERFLKKISKYASSEQTVIRLGVLSSLGTYILPLFLTDFLTEHPHVKIELYEDIPRRNELKLLNGELDFMIGQNPEMLSPNLVIHEYGKHGYYAIIPEKSPLYQKNQIHLKSHTIAIKELLQDELILTARGSAIRRQVDYLFQKYNVQPRIILESNNIFTIRELAKKNLGVTFLPESVKLSADEKDAHFNVYSLPLDLLSLDYFIAHPAEKTLVQDEKELIDSFMAHVKADLSLS